MFNFSILIDNNTAKGFEKKIGVCNSLLINNMEINDEIDGKSISELNGEEIENYRNLLISNNKKIALLNCSMPLSGYENYQNMFRKAYLLGVENIRIGMDNPCENKTENGIDIIENIRKICRIGKSYGIRALLENNSASFLCTDKNITDIYGNIKGEYTGLIFNPLEYARLKMHPFFNVFYNSKLKSDIKFLRVNDGLFVNGRPIMPAEGNAEIKEMTSILLARGFKGYFSFVPYFEDMDIDIYIKITGRFKKLLMEM